MSNKPKKPSGPRGNAEGKEVVDLNEVAQGTKNFIEKILGDVSKTSATKQLVCGGVSGWVTGFVSMRVGKAAATALGGGVLLLAIANHNGYIKVDWDKLMRHVDRVSDRVEEAATGDGPRTIDKVERFVNRKLDKAEAALRGRERRVRRWYNVFTTGEDGFHLNEMHIFLTSFVAGMAIGVVTG